MQATVTFALRDHVAWLTLNRPDASNTINLQLARDLLAAAHRCESERGVRAVVLTGAGRHFCFGGDLKGMMLNEDGGVATYLRELTTELHAAILRFTRLPAPVIAAVNGTAAGAGLGLVAMADLAIAAEGARFAPAYTGVGLTPDGSTSWFLPRLVGHKRAMELLLTNRILGAAEALDWGLVNRVVPDAALAAEAAALAARLAAGPREACGQVKRLLCADQDLPRQLDDEGRTIAAQGRSPEGREGVRAFLERRPPRYPG